VGRLAVLQMALSRGVYLVCRYRGISDTKEQRLPDGVRACWFDNNWPHVICR
jgi:hypothetical protein